MFGWDGVGSLSIDDIGRELEGLYTTSMLAISLLAIYNRISVVELLSEE